MRCRHRKNVNGAGIEFPGAGFWLFYFVSGFLIFMCGMRYAVRKAAVPIVGYQFLKMLFRR